MSDYIQVILWFFLIELLGLISIPLAGNAGNRLADLGISGAKTLGIMLVAYFSWIFSYVWGFTRTTILISFLVLCLMSIGFYWRKKTFPERKVLLVNELVFLAGFFFFLLVRVYLPEIYMHEKFMDFAFLNAIIKTSSFPPADPWFAGGSLDFYYYFGYLSVGALGKFSTVRTSILFNLAIALTFALCFNLFFGIGYNLSRGKIRYGLLTAGAGMLLGNLQGLTEFVSMYVFKEQVPMGYYWSSSRVIPFTINEFPYFTFIHGDLHSHMLAIPFQLLVMVFLLNIYFRKNERSIFENGLAFATFSIALGFLFPSNSWDFPVYFGLTLFVIFAFYYGHYVHKKNYFIFISDFSRAIVFVSVFSLLSYLPFYLSFSPQAAEGFDFVVPELRTSIDTFLILFALFLFLIFSFLIIHLDSKRRMGLFLLLAGFSALLSEAWSIPLLTILFPLLFLSLFFFLTDLQDRSASGFVCLLTATAAFISLLCEFIFLDDPISGNYDRMNTVFKFYMHLWVFFAIAASYSYYELLSFSGGEFGNRVLLKEIHVKELWEFVIVLLVISCSFFPLVSTFTRIMDMDAEPSLDGMEYMKEMDVADYNAIRWLQENIEESPVILEASEDDGGYSYTSRVSTNTGFPTVIGWVRHERFWGRDNKEVEQRIKDVRSIYSTDDEKKTLELMHKYNVSYVYIGKLEQQIYPIKFDKFENETYFEPVYRDTVTIYKLKERM